MNRAAEIGKLHRDAETDRIAIRDLLKQQKKEVGYGKWMQWLEDNKETLGFGVRQAQFYLLSDAKRVRMLEGRRLGSRAEEMHEEKKEERRYGKEILARFDLESRKPPGRFTDQILAAGYQQVSRRTHPDAGGTAEEQRIVNDTRDWMKEMLKPDTRAGAEPKPPKRTVEHLAAVVESVNKADVDRVLAWMKKEAQKGTLNEGVLDQFEAIRAWAHSIITTATAEGFLPARESCNFGGKR